MTISKSAISSVEDPVTLGKIETDNGSFADTPERRAYLNATESAAIQADNDAADFQNAVTRALQPDPNAVLDALDAQNMIEPSTRVRNGIRAARTMAYARDILKNPDRYQDGDAFAALNALSDGFAKDVSEWKRVQGMTDDPRQNLATYVNMLDGCATPTNLAAEPSSPYANYYEAIRSQETRDWDALDSAPLDVRFSHVIGKDPGGKRFTDVAKDWVHANLFDEDKITPEEEAAWVESEGGRESDAMRRYFANLYARGKSAKEIVRDRERQQALEGGAGVLVPSKQDDERIPDQEWKVNQRMNRDGTFTHDRIDTLTNLTLEEYAETEKRRDAFIMKRRTVDAYQKRMDQKKAEDRAHAMLPFLNEYEAAAALSAMRGEDMSKYKSFFENGFGNDTERRNAVWSVCASLRPRDAHGAWEDLIGRFGEGVARAAFLSGKAASSLWNAYTRWPEIIGTRIGAGREAAIAEKRMSDEELKQTTKDFAFALQYRQTMEAWIPNSDDNFAEQAVKGLADSGFLQGAAITGSLAHIGGSTLLHAPHPAAKIGGAALHAVGYISDALGAASMIGDSFENMMLNGVDADRAAAVGLYAGSLNYLIEKGNIDMFLGKGLSSAELRHTGFRALCKAIARKDPKLIAAALKANAKQAGRVALSECAEEFGQALVDSGALKFSKGDEFSAKAFANAYLNQDTLKDGIDGFIDAIPTCTGFGLMANHSPLRSKNAQAIDAYEQLAEETAKRYALQYHVDTANAEDMAKVKRIVLENAARHARSAAGMDVEQRRSYFGQAAQDAGMSPSEAAFYEQAADLYQTLTAYEGQQFADAALHGEINEAVLDRAGIAVGHDANGDINAVTVDGHTRTVVTEHGARTATDTHTGETGNVRGYYDPKDDAIHITVPETVDDVGKTARTTTAPHELLHAALEALANDPALTEEQRQTLDSLLKTDTPSPNGTQLDANEAAAKFVERVFAVANRDFTPDRETVAIGNIVRNIGTAIKNALGAKSEYLPAIVRKAGKGGISITDLLDPSFLGELDSNQIADVSKGTADPVVAWYANTMQPFFKTLVDAKSRTETTANLDAAEAETASERGDKRGDSAAAGITFENTTTSTGDLEPVADTSQPSQPSQPSQSSQPTRPTMNLPNGYTAEYELEEMPLSYVVMPGDPDYDQNLANLYALQEAEPADGVPVIVGGGNLLCGANAIQRALAEGKTRIAVRRIRRLRKDKQPSDKPSATKEAKRIAVRRIRRLRKDKQPSDKPSATQEAKRTGVRRFVEVHGNAYPALRYWLEHGRHIIDRSDPYIKAYLDNLSSADRMFLTGFGKGGTTADLLVEDFLNQYRSATETTNERHYDGTMKPEDVLDQALRERDAYRQWKADGALSPDEQQARDEHDKFIFEGHTEEEWNQHLEDLGKPIIGDETTTASDAESAAIDAQIAEDKANGFFSLVREYDDILGDQLAALDDAPRYSLARTPAEQTVYDRYHDANGKPRNGWENVAARRKDLLAVHNLNVDSIKKIADMGGFAMPSIAVIKDEHGHREFGDCTVLFDKSTIDPKKNRQNALYSHDAWTPSFPKLEPHIDMKAAHAFTKTIRELVDKANVGDVVRSWYSFDDEQGVERMLDHADSLAKAYAYETAAKAAYLVSQDRPVERVMTPADYSQKMPYKLYFLNNDQIIALGEKFGKRIFDSDGFLTGDFDDKLAKDIQDWSQPYRKDGKPVKNLDNGDVYRIGQTLLDIRHNGMDDQFDRYETENRIQKAVSSEDPGLVKWLEGLTKEIVTEYGVWNGKESFDARGNRRSWKALHKVPTLENIVKSMKKTQLENGSGVLIRNTFGVAVKKFRSTKDMISNENLLKPITHEEEKAIKYALSERLSALVVEYMQTNEHPDNNQFIEHDRALDMMFDAWEQGRGNFTSMKKLLNGWGYSADDDLVQRIKGVFDDMSVMVTNYFEAKPRRAVRFDEMKAWIVPDTITPEDRKTLEDNGQRIYTYKAGDETDRLRAVNAAADETDVRFSLHVNPNLRADVEAALVKRVSSDDQSHQMKRHDEIVFSEDFPFFEFLGLPNVRVVSDVVKIRKFAIKHHLTEDQIADLPNRYNNPVAVMKDADGGYVALTDMKAQTDNGEEKPVRVYLRPKTWRSGEIVFVATAMAENAADERKYYEPLAKYGLLFADENRIAGLGLEEETESILRTQASGDRVLTASDYSWWSTRNSIANPAANVNAPRFSLSLGIEGEGDPFAAKNSPVDFLLAHRIFANGGKPPSREETDKLLKRFGSKEAPRDVLARAVSLSQNIAGFLDKIGQNPDVVRAVAAAGLALEAKGAQTRAQNALMTFDAKAADAKGKIDAAYRRQVENASGIGYREMLSYYGLDMEQILLAMPPPPQRATTRKDEAEDSAKPETYELTDADRAAVDAAVAAIVSRGEGLAAAANAEHPGRPEKASLRDASSDATDDAETDPAFLRAQTMNAAVVDAVRKSGITIDNPLAMVALIRRLTEDYIRRNPDTVPDFNDKDPFHSRVALAVFAANLSQFAQAVAQGYAPSHARVRIARLCERLDARGLTTLNQVERVGEMIFADLSRDVIRQSRADLMRNLHHGDAPKKGEAKDPNRWRGIDYYAKKHGVNLAEPDRVVSAFAGNYLRILKRTVELSQAKAAERAAKLQETIDAFKDTDDKAKYRDYQNALLELDILAAYGALRTKMPAEIADKSAAIKSFVTSDLDAINAKKEAFEQKRVTLRDAMTAAIQGNPKDNGRMPDRHPGFLYSLVGMLDARASVLTSFCADAAKRQSALDAFAYVQRLLFHGYTQERAFLNDAKVAMRDAVKSVFGRFGQNTFAKLLDTKLDEATCKLLDRGNQKTKWRIGNVMQMYVSCLQSDYADNCKTHGRDAAYVQQLKSVIENTDPRLLRMIDVMRTMYAEYGKEISKSTLAASGVPIQTPNPLYMPVKPLLLMRAKNGEGRAFHPYAPALTPRVKHGYDFDQSADIMDMWQDRIQQSAHTIGFLEAAPLIQGTMQSSHVLEAIRAAWGEQYANHWNDYVLTCLAGRKATSMPKVMAALSRAASRLFLWFNVGSNLNQLQAVFTSALSRDVGGIRDTSKHLSFWALKPVEMWQAARDLTATRAFKARYGSDLNAAIAAAQREGKYGVLRSTVGTITDVGMKGIEIGDKIGVLALANVYRSERIALENAGMSPAEASEQAAEKLMLIAENTAQGTTDMNTFDEQSRLGSLTSLFMQFKTAPLQQFGYEFAAFKDWQASPTDPKRAMKLLSTIIVNHVLANIVPTAIDALMTTIFGAIRGDDDKEKEKNRRHVVARALARAFLGPFGAVMFYGVIADNAVQFVANWMTEGKPVRKPYGSSGSLPADNAVEMILNAAEGGATALFKSLENGTLDDLVEATKEAAVELSTMTYPGRIIKKSKPKKKKQTPIQ